MKRYIVLLLFIVSNFCSLNGQIIASVKQDGKWGFIDTNGAWFIDPIFDSVGSFYNSYAEIYVGESEGLIDYHGTIIIQHIYEFVGNVIDDMVDILLDDYVGYINVKTNYVIEPKFADGNEFSEGLAAVMNDDEKWGFIDTLGNLVIPFKYDDSDWYFKNDSIQVALDDEEFFINKNDEYLGRVPVVSSVKKELSLDEKRSKLKLMNPSLEKLSIPYTGYRQDAVFWFKAEEKFGLADTSGQMLIAPIYDYIWYFSEGVAPVRQKDSWGFVFPDGKIATPLNFEKVNNFKNGLAAAKLNGKWGFLDLSGQWVIPPVYEQTGGYFRNLKAKTNPIVKYERN